jgi:hypothetical protein
MRGKAGALGVLAQFREAFLQQEELACRGNVRRGARPIRTTRIAERPDDVRST